MGFHYRSRSSQTYSRPRTMYQPRFLFSFPLVFIFFVKSDGNPIFTNCPSFQCGTVTIRYPFWQMDNMSSQQYCGYPGLGLNCSTADNLIFHIPDDTFYVRNINYDNNTVSLVDIDTANANLDCPRPRHNYTLPPTLPLAYSALDTNLSFFFNCTFVIPFANPIECLRSDEKESYVFLSDNEPEDYDLGEYCQEKVVATVVRRGIDSNPLSSWYGGALNEGFVLDWRVATECRTCEESHGRCGYNNVTGNFVCYCSNGDIKTDRCKGRGLNLRVKLIIGFSAAGGSIFFMCLIFYIYYRRTRKGYVGSYLISRNISSYPSSMTDFEKAGTYLGVHIFDYKELEKATNKFDSDKTLGDGGFGTVYQGKLRDGRVVAVKRLYENNYKRVEQFLNEVEILARLRHQNLVSLYGCTTHRCHELLLVYEYIPNGTVADHLHGERAKPGALIWTTRLNIAIETANALVYLHASDIIHRDVKTNNILLDKNFGVKVADFGLSRLFPTDVTHVSTAPQGTPGYVDPEYHECYQLTDKSDVFSFGVVLVELISSKPAVDITRHRHEINLSNMAVNKIRNHTLHEFVDPNLGFESDYKVRKTVKAVAELAFQCLQNEREMRPSMEEVLEELKGIQCRNYSIEKEDGVTTDDVVLLKNNPEILSPDSVAVKWVSSSTISSASTG